MEHPFIGHCKRCKLSKRFDAPEVSRRHKSLRSGFEWRTVHDITRDVSGAAPFQGQSFQGNTVQAVEFHDRPGSMWLKCPAGHNVEFKAVRGRKTDEPCSEKCLSAHGNSCECACGGKNHGVNHV